MKSRLLKKICIIHLQLEIALTRSWFIQNFSRNQSIKHVKDDIDVGITAPTCILVQGILTLNLPQ